MAHPILFTLGCLMALLAPPPGAARDALRQDLARARERVYPALVNITVVDRFYAEGRAQRMPAGGSGAIVTPQGHVVTNFHVAGRSTRITCTLLSGESLDASVVVQDPLTDLTVLKLRAAPGRRFTFAPLGDSGKMQVGDHVIALGNPMNLSSSLTLGVVSNTHRVFVTRGGNETDAMDLEGERTGLLTRWIQHDALILPGNSGGPLVNLQGEIVGVNELAGQGMGFAIPSSIVRDVLRAALTRGVIHRGSLEVSFLPVGKLGRKTGVLIGSVQKEGAGARAGIKPGDILLAVNGRPVSARFLEEGPIVYQSIAALSPGSAATLKLERAGKALHLRATVAELGRFLGAEDEVRSLGVTVQEVTRAMGATTGMPVGKGVVITGVRAGYPLEGAQPQIQPGDLVTSLGGIATPTLADFRRAAAGIRGEVIAVIQRREEQIVCAVTPREISATDIDTELPRAWLGVRTQVVTPQIAGGLNLGDATGFRITRVLPGTEAAKAGLKIGDILVALDGEPLTASRVQDSDDLRRMIEERSVGEKVKFEVLRGKSTTTATVALQGAPLPPARARQFKQEEFEFIVREIAALDRAEVRWPNLQGVVVREVTVGGWAQMSGLEADDLVMTVNGTPTPNCDRFAEVMVKILKERPRTVRLFVQRGPATTFVFIEPDWDRLKTNKGAL